MSCNKAVVDSYIAGEDIENIDLLENNPEFMLDVICTSNDAGMYRFCTNEVKLNSGFVKGIINHFKRSNPDFVFTVADNYLANPKNDVTELYEVCNLMDKTFDGERSIPYSCKLFVLYDKELNFLSRIEEQEGKEKFECEYGEGFSLLCDKYSSSDKVKDYLAERLVDFLLGEYEEKEYFDDLEDYIHANYDSVDKINTRDFIINYVSKSDQFLGIYLRESKTLSHIFKKWESKIAKVKANWNTYICVKEKNNYINAFEMIEHHLRTKKLSDYKRFFIKQAAIDLNIYDSVNNYYQMLIGPTSIVENNDGVLKRKWFHGLEGVTVPKRIDDELFLSTFLIVKRILAEQLYNPNARSVEAIVADCENDITTGEVELVKSHK